jgi:hypothetical protein
MDSPMDKIRPDETLLDKPRSNALALIKETTEVLGEQRRVLKDLAHCLFNRMLPIEPGPGGRGRKARDFNQFMAEAEKKLAAIEAERDVLEKLRETLAPADDARGDGLSSAYQLR